MKGNRLQMHRSWRCTLEPVHTFLESFSFDGITSTEIKATQNIHLMASYSSRVQEHFCNTVKKYILITYICTKLIKYWNRTNRNLESEDWEKNTWDKFWEYVVMLRTHKHQVIFLTIFLTLHSDQHIYSLSTPLYTVFQ